MREALSGRGLDTRQFFVDILHINTACKQYTYVCGNLMACFQKLEY